MELEDKVKRKRKGKEWNGDKGGKERRYVSWMVEKGGNVNYESSEGRNLNPG